MLKDGQITSKVHVCACIYISKFSMFPPVLMCLHSQTKVCAFCTKNKYKGVTPTVQILCQEKLDFTIIVIDIPLFNINKKKVHNAVDIENSLKWFPGPQRAHDVKKNAV